LPRSVQGGTVIGARGRGAGARLNALRQAVESRGLDVLIPTDLAVGSDWVSRISKKLSQADLVIAVVTSDPQSRSVFFDLGLAAAFGRRIMLITTLEAEPISFPLHRSVVLRIDLENREAIDFALDQILLAPDRTQLRSHTSHRQFRGMGSKSDDLISSLDHAIVSGQGLFLEKIVAEALRSSGADLVVESAARGVRADIAVWSDALEPFVGNPLLVELKLRIRGKGDARQAARQTASYVDISGARWALLLFGEGPDSEEVWSGCPPNVLVLSVRSLLEALRTRPFPEVVRDLRNKRVHGASSS
jgi:TIR domain